MTENRVVALRQKGAIDDPLTEILRTGARRLIAQAVEAEFETFLASTAEFVLPDGRRRVVRHGHDPVRAIQTGIGPIEVQKPKARDRAAASGERIRFTSNILPKWARRTKSLDALLPVLYLRGISAGDFQEALAALLGKDAPNLSAAVIARLKSEWEDEYRRWQKRDLSARKGPGKEAKLCFMGHALMENRNGLVVDACLTEANGHAERIAALHMIEPRADRPTPITLGADKAYDAEDFVNELRSMNATPHVAQNASGRSSAIDRRTTRHAGYALSQRIRKRIEEAFGWIKTIAGQERTKFRGRERVGWAFTFAAAAYNLARLPKLLEASG